jgi:hypothetical protein
MNILALDVVSASSLLILCHRQHCGNDATRVGSENALVVNTKIYCMCKQLSATNLKLCKVLTAMFLKNNVSGTLCIGDWYLEGL